MKSQLSHTEKKILAVIQEGFPDSLDPYEEMAKNAGIKVEQLLNVLKKWKKQGKLRRIGAIVNHFKMGLSAGAMVAWKVEAGRAKDVGHILAGFKDVSHAYERQVNDNWPYNLYSMIHGKSAKDVRQIVQRISSKCRVSDYRILYTEKELKKTPPTYINRMVKGKVISKG